MAWDIGLAGPALRIAACLDNPLRVMAGPGTGKSFAMQRRVARLLEQDHVPPERILAVTFTRNAAANLVQDLHGLGVPGCEEIRSGTLQSFCFSVRGRQNVFQYFARAPRPLITFNKTGVAQFEYQPMLEDVAYLGAFGGKRGLSEQVVGFDQADNIVKVLLRASSPASAPPLSAESTTDLCFQQFHQCKHWQAIDVLAQPLVCWVRQNHVTIARMLAAEAKIHPHVCPAVKRTSKVIPYVSGRF